MKRPKKKKQRRKFTFREKDICPNCRKLGLHFVPPCLGDKGFFICKPKGGERDEQ